MENFNNADFRIDNGQVYVSCTPNNDLKREWALHTNQTWALEAAKNSFKELLRNGGHLD